MEADVRADVDEDSAGAERPGQQLHHVRLPDALAPDPRRQVEVVAVEPEGADARVQLDGVGGKCGAGAPDGSGVLRRRRLRIAARAGRTARRRRLRGALPMRRHAARATRPARAAPCPPARIPGRARLARTSVLPPSHCPGSSTPRDGSEAIGRVGRRPGVDRALRSWAVTAVLFTCAGQRVDVVTAFGRAGARTVAVDANPLAPAIYPPTCARSCRGSTTPATCRRCRS